MLESKYQKHVIDRLRQEIPGCVVIKLVDTNLQGIPDLEIIIGDWYGFLEIKNEKDAKHQPNQDFYITLFDRWNYASFIYPENEEIVFNEIQQSLESKRDSCSFESQSSYLDSLRRETPPAFLSSRRGRKAWDYIARFREPSDKIESAVKRK